MKKVILAPVVALALVLVSVALAGGGKAIDPAPPVPFGQQVFGDTSQGTEIEDEMREYWKLSLIAGDRLTIKFKQGAPGYGVSQLRVYLRGTDDFNLSKAEYHYSLVSSNGFGQLDYDVPASGTYPLVVLADYKRGGAYDFTATVKHRVRLSSETKSIPRRGVFKAAARFPDGASVTSGLGGTLYGNWDGNWRKLGQAAVKTGTLSVRYTLPVVLRGKKLKLRLTTGGPSFFGARFDRTVAVR